MMLSRVKHKRRSRTVLRTALIYCDGVHHLAFVRHLTNLYTQAGMTRARIKSKQGDGDMPDILLTEARNVLGSFDQKIITVSGNGPLSDAGRVEQLAAHSSIRIIWITPCVESLLLSILEGKDYSRYTSQECRKIFEDNYIPTNKRIDSRAYSQLFPLEKIEAARKILPQLDAIITVIVE